MKGNFLKEKYLLLRARNKDPEAYSQVYDLYVDKIYRFIFFKVNSQEEAQDLTSEVFLKVWQSLIDGTDIKNLNAFFYKVARNLVIDYYRQARQKDVSLEADIVQNSKELAVNEIAKVEAKLRLENLEDKLKLLKDEYREIIVLRYIEGLNITEIAEIIDKKKGNIRVILYRAVNTLKDLLEEDGQE